MEIPSSSLYERLDSLYGGIKISQRTFSVLLFVVYLIALHWIILFKMTLSLHELPNFRSINLVLFAGSAVINNRIDLDEIISNIIIFVPFGIYLSMLKPNWFFLQKVVLIASVSLLFEAIQFIFAIGATDITDFAGNTLGGIIGMGVYYMLANTVKNERKLHRLINDMAMICTICTLALLGLLLLVGS